MKMNNGLMYNVGCAKKSLQDKKFVSAFIDVFFHMMGTHIAQLPDVNDRERFLGHLEFIFDSLDEDSKIEQFNKIFEFIIYNCRDSDKLFYLQQKIEEYDFDSIEQAKKDLSEIVEYFEEIKELAEDDPPMGDKK
jgi:hypothetical protein